MDNGFISRPALHAHVEPSNAKCSKPGDPSGLLVDSTTRAGLE